MKRIVGFWILFAVTLAVYLTMILWSLRRIAADADGLAPLDLRPGGYDLEDATAFLTALSDEGRAFYLGTQHALDAVYPALLALTLASAIFLLAPKRLGWVRHVLPLAALPLMIFDYLENAAVTALLKTPVDALTPELVETASRWSVLKAQATTGAAILTLAMLIVWGVRRMRRRGNA